MYPFQNNNIVDNDADASASRSTANNSIPEIVQVTVNSVPSADAEIVGIVNFRGDNHTVWSDNDNWGADGGNLHQRRLTVVPDNAPDDNSTILSVHTIVLPTASVIPSATHGNQTSAQQQFSHDQVEILLQQIQQLLQQQQQQQQQQHTENTRNEPNQSHPVVLAAPTANNPCRLNRRISLLIFGLLVPVVVIVFVLLIDKDDKEKKADLPQDNGPETPSNGNPTTTPSLDNLTGHPSVTPFIETPTNNPTILQTLEPTTHPNLRPSSIPTVLYIKTAMPSISNMPTTISHSIAQQFQSIDPNLNINVLLDESTPQFRAIDWIVKNEKDWYNNLLQHFVILTLYYSSSNFGVWIESYPYFLPSPTRNVCNWNDGSNNGIGIFCTGGQISKIEFWQNDDVNIPVSGSLPTEIGLLSQLTSLIFAWNDMNGTIPSQLGMLQSLSVLDLSRNRFVGVIPSELGNLSSLERLNLRTNEELSGSIPIELGNLQSLTYLSMSENFGITGTIPDGFQKLSKLFIQGTSIEDELNCDLFLDVLDVWANCLDGAQIKCEGISDCCSLCCDENGKNCIF